jgi:hypothetical protein
MESNNMQEAENLLNSLQNTRLELKRMMKCTNEHPFLAEINAQIHGIRVLLKNWDDGKWEDIRWGRTF